MPTLDAHRFLARVANDENLIMRMVTESDEEILRIASNMGLSFTPAELHDALATTLEPTELSATELESVAGDVGIPLVPEHRERLGQLSARLDPGLDADQIRSQSQSP